MIIAQRDRRIDKLIQPTAINVQMNKHLDLVSCDDVGEDRNKFLLMKVSMDSIAQYAFAHSVHNHKIAKGKGATTVRHCPLIIWLG